MKIIIILLIAFFLLSLIGVGLIYANKDIDVEIKSNDNNIFLKDMEVEYYDKNISLDQAMNNLIVDFRVERDLYSNNETRNQIRLKYVEKLKLLREKYLRKW